MVALITGAAGGASFGAGGEAVKTVIIENKTSLIISINWQ